MSPEMILSSTLPTNSKKKMPADALAASVVPPLKQ